MQFALQPCSAGVARRNFEKTIQSPVPRDSIVPHLQAGDLEAFDGLNQSDARVWGITRGVRGVKIDRWNRLRPGDRVLFYRDSHFFGLGRIALKVENAALADSLWGKDDGGASYDLLYFVNELVAINLPVAKFNDIISGTSSELVNHPIRSFDVLYGLRAARLAKALAADGFVPKPQPPAGSLKPKKVSRTVGDYVRDDEVRQWVLDRARGACEGCLEPAPFLDSAGQPFLEVHHMIQLSLGGSDRITNAVALCPNCHRRLHHGQDAETCRKAIWARLSELVPE